MFIISLAPSLLKVRFHFRWQNFALVWHDFNVLINVKIFFCESSHWEKLSISIEKKVFNIYIEFWRVLILHVNKMYLLDLIEPNFKGSSQICHTKNFFLRYVWNSHYQILPKWQKIASLLQGASSFHQFRNKLIASCFMQA